ncbi:DUF368 domain-containing protein [Lentisphaerota bacterium WC36G]|nr:DUF368 domain-containing protein [Lentisphaerae bacterium WC36]
MNEINNNEKKINKFDINLKKYSMVSAKGFAMGAANVIPGVSGGTVAFVTGIYEELIGSLKYIASKEFILKILKFKIKEILTDKAVQFLIALALGVFVAIVAASNIFTYSLAHYPEFTFSFFAGLVAASIISVLKEIKKWGVSRIIAIISGTIIAYFVVNMVPVETPQTWWMFLIGGVIFMCAMILPGLSGSFLMLILGQYTLIWGAVKSLARLNFKLQDLTIIFFVGVGAVLGLGMFSHLLNWVFKKFHDLTVAVLTGFMVGSLWKLWPWKEIVSRSVRFISDVGDNKYETITENIYQTMLENPEVKIEKARVLVDKNVLPQAFEGQFYGVVGLFVIGFISVIILEMVLKKDNKELLENNNEG